MDEGPQKATPGTISSRPSPSHRSRGTGRRARGGTRRVLGLIATLLAVIVFSTVAFVGFNYYQDASGKPGGSPITVFVKEGATYQSLADVLQNRDVVGSSLYFRIYLRLHSLPILHPGIYYLHRYEPYSKVLSTLTSGPVSGRLTLMPGVNLNEIAAQVGKIHGHSAASFLKAAVPQKFSFPYLPANPVSLEGLLYPDTYFVDPLESNHQIIQTMLNRFGQIADSIRLEPAQQYFGLSSYQVIVGASIIQKEATNASDMPKVARVILNRLAAGMSLQMDSTVRYATKNFSQPITVTQLESPSPYNTYVHLGLPPSPISAPSIQALRAMLNPTPGAWLYFVALKGQSVDSFFNTFSEQQAAIAAAGGEG